MSATPAPSPTSSSQPANPHGPQNPPACGTCPECEAVVTFTRAPLSGQVVSCGGCGAELEVTSREPLTLQLAPEVEEDWGE